MTTSPVTNLEIDVSRLSGVLKPLHGLNNGPVGYGSLVDVAPYYSGIRVPDVRLHDPNWPHPREVDVPQIFPDFEADPEDPASYDFAGTDTYIRRILDTGARVVYRLGVSIEHTERKVYTHPPADFGKWARVCLGIVRHYNFGWADGYHDWVAYWEIWNEADIGDRMWSGTWEQYFELYAVAARTLKSYAPELKVGGPATATLAPPHPAAGFLGDFLAFCRRHACPLDFVSWHKYTTEPSTVVSHAREVKALMEHYGFCQTESHLNEWNYTPFEGAIWGAGNEVARRRGFERQKNEEGASFVAATLSLLQDEPVDVANYYDGQPSALYCGIFDYYGVPQKTYYALKAFSRLLDYPGRLAVSGASDDAALTCIAAGGPSGGSGAALISRFGGERGDVHVRLAEPHPGHAPTYQVRLIDRANTYEVVLSGRLPEDGVTVPMDAHAVALVTFEPALA